MVEIGALIYVYAGGPVFGNGMDSMDTHGFGISDSNLSFLTFVNNTLLNSGVLQNVIILVDHFVFSMRGRNIQNKIISNIFKKIPRLT